MAVTTAVQHNYTFGYTANGNNVYTITWYDNGTTVVCTAPYTIIADSAEDLTRAITLEALALRSANAKLFKENEEPERGDNFTEVTNG